MDRLVIGTSIYKTDNMFYVLSSINDIRWIKDRFFPMLQFCFGTNKSLFNTGSKSVKSHFPATYQISRTIISNTSTQYDKVMPMLYNKSKLQFAGIRQHQHTRATSISWLIIFFFTRRTSTMTNILFMYKWNWKMIEALFCMTEGLKHLYFLIFLCCYYTICMYIYI